MSCPDNPKSKKGWRKLLSWSAPHSFLVFKAEPAGTYEYHLHYKCQYCGSRRRLAYVDESPEILEWIKANEVIDALKGKDHE